MMKQKKITKITVISLCLTVLLSLAAPFAPVSADKNEETVLNSTVIVSMGDSYSAGEGIEDFYDQDLPADRKVQSQDWLAHRSEKSWPGRLTLPAVKNGDDRVPMAKRRDTNWYFVAASGAVTADITNPQEKEFNYKWNIGTEYLTPQIDVFDRLGDKKVDYVTMTLGGNDVGFADVIKNAATNGVNFLNPNSLQNKIAATWKEYDDHIKDDIKNAYKTIYQRAAQNNPKVKVIVAGYPELMSIVGSGFLFNATDADIINSAVRKFNKELEGIVNSLKEDGMRICFVPVAHAFQGFEAYTQTDEADEYINRVMVGAEDEDINQLCATSSYSIHPNSKGAQAYADCVQAKIDQIEKDGGKSEWPLLTGSDERDAVLVLDGSSSMSGTPLQETKTAAERFVDTILYEDVAISVVTYDNSAKMLCDFNKKESLLKDAIQSMRATGGTNIEAGLAEAEKLLVDSEAKKKFVILMSDGEPTRGKSGEELVQYASELKEKGLRIYTLGFFSDISDRASAVKLMGEIASPGCHFEVDDAEQLKFFFEDIADQISGQDYQLIQIACPVDVKVSYGGETLSSKDAEKTQRTSFGTLTFEENPEATGNGTDERIKILRLKGGVSYDIQISGNGKGSMDYTIGFMDENGEYTDMRKFTNIKINKKTEISTVAARTASTTLKVDEDGDGKYDYVYKAGANGKGRKVDSMTPFWIALAPAFLLIFILLIMIVVAGIKRKRRKTA